MAVLRKFDAQIVVPCMSETKQAIEALADLENLSNADIIRRCIDAHLPVLITQFSAARKVNRTESRRLAG
jgi:hypothetical protein